MTDGPSLTAEQQHMCITLHSDDVGDDEGAGSTYMLLHDVVHMLAATRMCVPMEGSRTVSVGAPSQQGRPSLLQLALPLTGMARQRFVLPAMLFTERHSGKTSSGDASRAGSQPVTVAYAIGFRDCGAQHFGRCRECSCA